MFLQKIQKKLSCQTEVQSIDATYYAVKIMYPFDFFFLS